MIQKIIRIDEDLYNKAKIQAVTEGIPLMQPNGWISQAISEKLERSKNKPIDWTKTEDFKRLAREFCKSEGWTQKGGK
jgi:hypothetical protein